MVIFWENSSWNISCLNAVKMLLFHILYSLLIVTHCLATHQLTEPNQFMEGNSVNLHLKIKKKSAKIIINSAEAKCKNMLKKKEFKSRTNLCE